MQPDPALLSRYGRMAIEGQGQFRPDLGAYVAAGIRLSEIEAEVEVWLTDHPIALCPVTPVPAPIASEGITTVDGEPVRQGGKLTLCTYANDLGLPAASVLAGRDSEGLPLGVQVIGRRGCDLDVVAVARALEQALGGWLDPSEAPAGAIPAAR